MPKTTPEALAENEERFRLTFENANTGLCLLGLDGRHLKVNSRYCHLSGYSGAELEALTIDETAHPEDRPVLRHHLGQLQAGAPTACLEMRQIHPDGRTLWVQAALSLVRDEAGRPLYFLEQVQDITERKKAEAALAESEERYRLLAEHSGDVIMCIDVETLALTYVSPSVKRTSGFTPEEIMALGARERMTPSSFQRVLAAVEEERRLEWTGIADPNRTRTLELEIYHKLGHTYWVEMTMSYLRDQTGRPRTILGVSRDVTIRKQAEETLRESEAKYRAVVDNALEGIVVLQDGHIVFTNKKLGQQSGYSEEELRSRPFLDFVHPEDMDLVFERYQRFLAGEEVENKLEFRVVTRPGRTEWREVALADITWEGRPATLVFSNDITERKRAELALQNSERLYRDLVQAIPYGIEEIDLEGRIIFSSLTHHRLLGYEPGELIGKYIWDLGADPAESESMKRNLALVVRNQPEPTPLHTRNRTKDGRVIDLLVTWTYHRHKSGRLLGFISILTDITDQRRAQASLLEKEKELETQARNLEEANTALKVLLDHREAERMGQEENILATLKKLVFPHLEKLKQAGLAPDQSVILEIMEANLKHLTSSFARRVGSADLGLTPREIEVAELIKAGKTSKEIAELLHTSLHTISYHRGNIRDKLGLAGKKGNLRTRLMSLMVE
ncbi:MAG: PAS domain S-box protein [Thermodesulfobacteriota bacterium]